jgi:uncharacterized Zn-binding protein involved in type VI secretion
MTATPGWADERLEAAFLARAAAVRPAPADLPAAVFDGLRRTPRISSNRPRALLAAAASIVVVVALGGLAAFALTTRPPVAASTSPEPPGTGPLADAARELGLSPQTVESAIAVHTALQDDSEMLVSGYLSNDTGPTTDGGPVVHADCDLAFRVLDNLLAPACSPLLMQLPEPIVTRTLNDYRIRVPSGPAVHPVFALTVLPATKEVPIVGDAEPAPIAVVGHFSDRRSASCPPGGGQQACATSFVVDRVVAVNGVAVARSGDARAEDVVAATVPGMVVLSVKTVEPFDLPTLEPSFRGPADIPAALGTGSISIVTTLPASAPGTAPRAARTFLVGDGLDTVVEMTAEGPAIRTSPSAPPASGPVDASVLADLVAHPITVSQAIAIRDGARDDTELAVAGYAVAPGVPIFCTLALSGKPALDQCPNTLTWLSDQRPAPAVGATVSRPSGPAMNLLVQPESILQIAPGAAPFPVVAIGHFDDHRSGASCPSPEVVRCQKNYIVDAIVDPANPRFAFPALKLQGDTLPIDTRDEAIAAAGLDPRDPRVVAAFAFPKQDLAAFEPQVRDSTELDGIDVVWIIRFVERENLARPVLRTRLVADRPSGQGQLSTWYDVTSTGLVAGGVEVVPAPSAPGS